MNIPMKKIFLTQSLLVCPLLALAQQTEKPNVIIILADDLGYADVGYHDQSTDIKTPNIDKLAAGGVHCTTAYVTNAVSSPSRAGMLSGRYQQSFGYEDNPGPFRREEGIHPGFPSHVKLIPEYLKQVGYATACIGKWHLGGEESDDSYPTNKGFDEFFGFLGGATTYFHQENQHELIFRNQQSAIIKDAYLTDMIGDETIDFISRHKEVPFMVYMSFNAVHGPLEAPKRLIEQYAHVKDEKRRALCAMQHSMDENIGRVMKQLDDMGIAENTLIFFFSDNGGAPTDNHSYNAPFRGAKGTFYDGGIHTPFIMKWPKIVQPNSVYEKMVSSLDIAPTILAAAGMEVPSCFDGVDLMPYLDGRKSLSPHEELCWKMNKQWAIRNLEWKLVCSNPDNRVRLFHISEDPYEKIDLASTRPDIVRKMKTRYDAWDAKNPPILWGWQPQVGTYVQHTDEGFENICKTKFVVGNDFESAKVVNNPLPNDLNKSKHVLSVRLDEINSTVVARVPRFNKQFRYAHLKVLKQTKGVVKFQISGDKFLPLEVNSLQPYNTAGQWQELVFDLNYYHPVEHTKISFEGVADGETIYLDDIMYSNSVSPGLH